MHTGCLYLMSSCKDQCFRNAESAKFAASRNSRGDKTIAGCAIIAKIKQELLTISTALNAEVISLLAAILVCTTS